MWRNFAKSGRANHEELFISFCVFFPGMGLSTQTSRFGTLKRDAYRLSGHSKSFGLAKSNENGLVRLDGVRAGAL